MAGTGGRGGSMRDVAPVVNTWDKTITVSTGNSARGNSVARTIPNPNYIDRAVAPTSASDTFKKLLASGEIKPVYGQKDVSRGQSGATDRVTDLSNFKGYMRTLPDGRVEGYDATGKSTGVRTPNTGGGGLFGAIGGAISDIGGGISDAVSTVSRDIASSPEAMAIITAIAASQGVDPATTASILGANRAGKDGNIQAGLETAALSYALGSNVSSTSPTSATTAPVSGGTTGGWTSLGEAAGGTTTAAGGTTTAAGGTTSTLLPGGLTGGAGSTTGLSLPAGSQFTGLGLETVPTTGGLMAGGGSGLTAGSTIGSAAATSAAANSLAPSLGTTGLLQGAPTASTAATASSTGGKMGTLGTILDTAKEYAPLLGALAGAASSGDTKTSTTADKSPWAPAQEWMKANLGLGPKLQAQYAANPFSQFQKQAYNNSAQLGNQFRSNLNGLIPQMNAFRPYQRTPQSQVVAPMQFAPANLGLTTNQFPQSQVVAPMQFPPDNFGLTTNPFSGVLNGRIA